MSAWGHRQGWREMYVCTFAMRLVDMLGSWRGPDVGWCDASAGLGSVCVGGISGILEELTDSLARQERRCCGSGCKSWRKSPFVDVCWFATAQAQAMTEVGCGWTGGAGALVFYRSRTRESWHDGAWGPA